MSTARAEAWAELEEAQAALNARRGELEQLREQAAAPGEGEWVVGYAGSEITTTLYQEDGQPFMRQSITSDGDTAPGQLVEKLTKRGDRYYLSSGDSFVITNTGNLDAYDSEGRIWSATLSLDEEVGADGEAFSQKLVNYINEAKWDLGGEMNEEQRAAFGMMSGERMYLAQEYAVKGGDYRQAIDILEAARKNDPDNPDLAARIAEYQDARYVPIERLAEVKRGMTEAEVEGVLGKVFHSYVRNFPDRDVFAWFYPKDPEQHGAGAAVGVFFNESDRKVYLTDPNAVEGKDDEEE